MVIWRVSLEYLSVWDTLRKQDFCLIKVCFHLEKKKKYKKTQKQNKKNHKKIPELRVLNILLHYMYMGRFASHLWVIGKKKLKT